MQIVDFTPLPALLGGLAIGVATAWALWLSGKIAGISGVFGRIFRAVPGDTAWRVWFLLGMGAGGGAGFALVPFAARYEPAVRLPGMLLAGLFVGFGTRLGGGCTSGHGVCGVARGSRRSVVATLTFLLTGVATVWLLRHAVGLP